MLLLCPEPLVFPFSFEEYKDYNVCRIHFWLFYYVDVILIRERTESEEVRELGAEEDNWAGEGGRDRRLDKIAQYGIS